MGEIFGGVFAVADYAPCLGDAVDRAAGDELHGDIAEHGRLDGACEDLAVTGGGGHRAEQRILDAAADNMYGGVGLARAVLELLKGQAILHCKALIDATHYLAHALGDGQNSLTLPGISPCGTNSGASGSMKHLKGSAARASFSRSA